MQPAVGVRIPDRDTFGLLEQLERFVNTHFGDSGSEDAVCDVVDAEPVSGKLEASPSAHGEQDDTDVVRPCGLVRVEAPRRVGVVTVDASNGDRAASGREQVRVEFEAGVRMEPGAIERLEVLCDEQPEQVPGFAGSVGNCACTWPVSDFERPAGVTSMCDLSFVDGDGHLDHTAARRFSASRPTGMRVVETCGELFGEPGDELVDTGCRGRCAEGRHGNNGDGQAGPTMRAVHSTTVGLLSPPVQLDGM